MNVTLENSENLETVENELPFETQISIVPQGKLVAKQDELQIVRSVPKYMKMVFVDNETGEVFDQEPMGTDCTPDFQYHLLPPKLGVQSFKAQLKDAYFGEVGSENRLQSIKIVPMFFQQLGHRKEATCRLFLQAGESQQPSRRAILWFFKLGEDRKIEPKLCCMVVKTLSFIDIAQYVNKVHQHEGFTRYSFETFAELSFSQTTTSVTKKKVWKIDIKYSSLLPPKYRAAVNDYRADLGKEFDYNGNLVKEYGFKEPISIDIFADYVAINCPEFDPENPDVSFSCEPFVMTWIGALIERNEYTEFIRVVLSKRKKYSEAGLL